MNRVGIRTGVLSRIKFGSTFYAKLGLPPSATTKEIIRAYRDSSRHVYPDKNGIGASHTDFLVLSEAYNTLKNPDSRRLYDVYLRATRDFSDRVFERQIERILANVERKKERARERRKELAAEKKKENEQLFFMRKCVIEADESPTDAITPSLIEEEELLDVW